MTTPTGGNSTLVISRETSWGTLPGSPKKFSVNFVSESLSGSESLIENGSISGDPNARDSVPDVYDTQGDIVIYPSLKSAPYFLTAALGSIATSGVGDPYQHVIKRAGASLPSYQIEVSFNQTTPQYKLIKGARVNRFSMGVSKSGFLQFTLGFVGKSSTISASRTLTTPTDWSLEAPLHNRQIDSADMNFLGVPCAEFRELSLDLNNNLITDDYRIGGDGLRASLEQQVGQLTGSLKAVFESLTVYNSAKNAVFSAIEWMYTEAVGAPMRTLDFEIPRARLELKDPTISGNGIVMLDLPFRASKDSLQATMFLAVAYNSEDGTNYV